MRTKFIAPDWAGENLRFRVIGLTHSGSLCELNNTKTLLQVARLEEVAEIGNKKAQL